MENPTDVAQLLLTRTAFLSLEVEWKQLATGAGPRLQFERLRQAVEALPEEEQLRVVTVRRAGVLVAATALVEGAGDAPRMELLGHQRCEAREVLAHDLPALERLLRALSRLHRTSVLRRLAVGSSAPATSAPRHRAPRRAPDGLHQLQRRCQVRVEQHAVALTGLWARPRRWSAGEPPA